MSLLSSIVEYGEGWLHAEVQITSESTFVGDGGVPSWIGLEYMAQAISAYAGLQQRLNGGTPKIGFLLGSRKYLCNTDYFVLNQTLLVKVHLEMLAENGLEAFNCELQGEGVNASAVVNVYQPEDAEKFLRNTI